MTTMTGRSLLTFALTLASASLLATRPAAAGPITDYVALGDSLAFGETDWSQNPSHGDRGYVALYANGLAAQNGGVRPNVINLGVDGETSSTFFNGGPAGDGTSAGHPAPQLNLNYPTPAPNQNALLLSTIAAEKAAGHNIGTVSVQLGANDLLSVMNTPGFFSLPAGQQQQMITQAMQTIQTHDTALLNELKTQLPNANILMMGYFNPFNADPNSPAAKLADPAIRTLNTLISIEAAAVGAKFVNTYAPFQGHEQAYTYIASGNVHPNAQGYAVIAGQMTTVPEPGGVLVAGAAVGAWLVFWRRPRRVSAA